MAENNRWDIVWYALPQACPQATEKSKIQWVDTLDFDIPLPMQTEPILSLSNPNPPAVAQTARRLEIYRQKFNRYFSNLYSIDCYICYEPEIDTVFIFTGEKDKHIV